MDEASNSPDSPPPETPDDGSREEPSAEATPEASVDDAAAPVIYAKPTPEADAPDEDRSPLAAPKVEEPDSPAPAGAPSGAAPVIFAKPAAEADGAGAPRKPQTSQEPPAGPTFADLGLPDFLLRALDEVGYESPSPIQAGAIPPLLEGRDMLGQAQTGTGKTAAFALPLLARLEKKAGPPQILVLTPTRELAIQVAEAFQRYGSSIRDFRVLPIYGGSSYDRQFHQLRRGVHAVVGTPGRVMDHIRRGTLELSQLSTLVLDEADEMLRMGFRDDVEWILGHTPDTRQVALFSATLPKEIRRIASAHMSEPAEIRVERKSATAETIRQRYWLTRGVHKLDALTRMLEVEPFDGMIVFVRTKSATVSLSEKLSARGFRAAPMNGDMPQSLREQTVSKMESGQLDILVATDVAARGLDLDRISHVVNFDVPYDIDSYVHRVGRTGRAGREGEAILFVAPRERRILGAIEQVTRSRIERMELPSISDVNDSRVARFEAKLTAALEGGAAREFQPLLESYQTRHDVPGLEIAAALASMLQGDQPFLLEERPEPVRRRERYDDDRRFEQRSDRGGPRDRPGRREPEEMVRYRVSVGRQHGAGAGDLVGAIAGETGLEGRRIGRIDLRGDHSFVELPGGMPEDIHRHLQSVVVRGEALAIEAVGTAPPLPRRDTRPRHSGDGPRKRPGGPPRYRDDAGKGGGFKRSAARGKYGSDARPPRGGGNPFRSESGKPFRPKEEKPYRPKGGEPRGEDRRSGGGFDLSKPRRSAKAGGFSPKPGGYPSGGPGDGGQDKPPRPKKDEPGGRRTGKKARWSKAQKRAAKKAKNKGKG